MAKTKPAKPVPKPRKPGTPAGPAAAGGSYDASAITVLEGLEPVRRLRHEARDRTRPLTFVCWPSGLALHEV